MAQTVLFSALAVGKQFTLNGDIWLKKSTRTARKVGSDEVRFVGKYAGVLAVI